MNPKASKLAFLLGSVTLLAARAAVAQSPSSSDPDFSGSWVQHKCDWLEEPARGAGADRRPRRLCPFWIWR